MGLKSKKKYKKQSLMQTPKNTQRPAHYFDSSDGKTTTPVACSWVQTPFKPELYQVLLSSCLKCICIVLLCSLLCLDYKMAKAISQKKFQSHFFVG